MDNTKLSLIQQPAFAAKEAPPEQQTLLDEAITEIDRLSYVPGKTYIECRRQMWLDASKQIEREVADGKTECHVLGKTVLVTHLQEDRQGSLRA